MFYSKLKYYTTLTVIILHLFFTVFQPCEVFFFFFLPVQPKDSLIMHQDLDCVFFLL